MALALAAQIAACGSLLIWLVLVFAWGNFWRIWESDADGSTPLAPNRWPRVVAIVPARNEAASIGAVVTRHAAQDYPGNFSVLIVDDHSEDGTADVARAAAVEAGVANRVRIIQALPLQPGWTGKLSALHSGVAAISEASDLLASCGTDFAPPEFFWFTDADVVHAPDALRRLVSRAEAEKFDLCSLMVLLRAETLAERFLIPPFLYFFLMLYPPRWIANRSAKTAGAAGGCVLLRRSALERIGGVAAIRGAVIDDCALARAVKRSGGKIWMGLTRASHSLRSYTTFSEIRDMIARTAFTQLHYSWLQLIGTLLGLAGTFLVPLVLTFSPVTRIWLPALFAWCLMSASFIPTVSFYRLSPIWAPLLPAATLFYSFATLVSAIRYCMGRGGQWKGRAQAAKSTRFLA